MRFTFKLNTAWRLVDPSWTFAMALDRCAHISRRQRAIIRIDTQRHPENRDRHGFQIRQETSRHSLPIHGKYTRHGTANIQVCFLDSSEIRYAVRMNSRPHFPT